MEFAAFLAGEKWTDHPSCTHPVLAALARDVNDLTSDAARDELMPLVHRVIGLDSDDPLFAATVAMRAASAALPVASLERQRALAVGMLALQKRFDSPALRALARPALDETPDAERWAQVYLRNGALPARDFGRRSAEAIVHTSVVGIALACIEHPDARLRALLEAAIVDAEQMLGRTPTAAPAPLPALV